MARQIFKLSAVGILNLKQPGRYGDGSGLWLQVRSSECKSWLFRFTLRGKSRQMGLGALHTVSLAEAREKALQCRKLLLDDFDPIEVRHVR